MKSKITLLLLMCISFITFTVTSQDSESFNPAIIPGSIPSSPAFSLLGVNPEIVTRPSDVKQFKVDWRIKNYKVAPDLALEAQPLWWLYYRNKSPIEYHKSSPFEKAISTLSFSLATAKMDNLNHIAWAAKMNVYKKVDSRVDNDYYNSKSKELQEQLKPLQNQLDTIEVQLYEEQFYARKDTIRMLKQLRSDIKYEMLELNRNAMELIREDAKDFNRANWNMDMLDIAFGRVYAFNNSALDSINFEKAGYGIWLNGSKGYGKHSLITGLVRLNRIGDNNNWLLGMSYRFGSEKFNFFTEVVIKKLNNHAGNEFTEEELFSEQHKEDLGTGWYSFEEGDPITTYTIAYGGDFRLSKNILLNFALRTEYNDKFKFKKLTPVANLICLMNITE